MPSGAVCALSAYVFDCESVQVKVNAPFFWKAGDVDGITLSLPTCMICTWCYEQMFNEDSAAYANNNTARKYDYR